jgi:hypothetical protein
LFKTLFYVPLVARVKDWKKPHRFIYVSINTYIYIYLFSVALTACSNVEYVNSGDVVKFPSVYRNYGLQNMTLFKQTGIFTCEQKGLYMFFSSITSTSKIRGYFRWCLNSSKYVSSIYVGNQNDFETGSGMVTLELAVGDTVSLKSFINNYLVYTFSCYTLIKIK